MLLAVPYAPLRHAVAHLLLAENLHGILCLFDCLVVLLDTLRASVSNDNVASINHELLVSAFKSDENEYILPYWWDHASKFWRDHEREFCEELHSDLVLVHVLKSYERRNHTE